MKLVFKTLVAAGLVASTVDTVPAIAQEACPIDNRSSISDGTPLSEEELIAYKGLRERYEGGSTLSENELSELEAFADRLEYYTNPRTRVDFSITDDQLLEIAEIYQRTFGECPFIDFYEAAYLLKDEENFRIYNIVPREDRQLTVRFDLPYQDFAELAERGVVDNHNSLIIRFETASDGTKTLTTATLHNINFEETDGLYIQPHAHIVGTWGDHSERPHPDNYPPVTGAFIDGLKAAIQ